MLSGGVKMNGVAHHTLSRKAILARLGHFGGVTVSILSLLCGVLLWTVDGSTELYKWTDDEGNFHITDTPPPGQQKKSPAVMKSAPRSASPKKAKIRPTLPGRPQAEVQPVPGPIVSSPANEDIPVQRAMGGLDPIQATLTSSWQIFDSGQVNAKAPVQWWKDQQGLDHFVDVLPVPKGGTEAGKIEDVSVSHPTRRAKERATGVSHSRHQTTE
jgi:hypothetical protein